MEKLAIFIFMLCIALFLMTVLDFAALHDIKKDYVSTSILDYLDIQPAAGNELPAWTDTPGEWQIVTISLILRTIFFALNLIVLGYFIRKSLMVSIRSSQTS